MWIDRVTSEIINTIPSRFPTEGEIAASPPKTVLIHTKTNICLLKYCFWNQSQIRCKKLTISSAWRSKVGNNQVIALDQAAPSLDVTKKRGNTADSPS